VHAGDRAVAARAPWVGLIPAQQPWRPRAQRRAVWHRSGVTADPWSAVFQRFADALNPPRDGAALRAAVVDDVRVDRHGPGARGLGPIVEIFRGAARVAGWIARTPAVVRFALAGAPWVDCDGAGCIEYAVRAGEFHNGGLWVARLAPDGRLAFLSHHPFALRAPET